MAGIKAAPTLFALLGFLSLIIPTALAASEANGTCYMPDGKAHGGLHSCSDPKTGHSACCPPNGYCMAGGLCWSGSVFLRAGCTDPTFADAACPVVCQNFGNKSIAQIISPWRVVPNTYCCGLLGLSNGTCYDNNGLEAPNGITIDTPPTVTSIANSSYGNLLPWLNLTGALLPGSQPVNATASGAVPGATNGVPATVEGPMCPSMTPAAPTSSNSGQVAAVGAGVGVSLGACLLGALLLNFIQWRRIRAMKAQGAYAAAPGQHTDASAPAYSSYAYNGGAAAVAAPKEMQQHDVRTEMEATQPVPELPGSTAHKPY